MDPRLRLPFHRYERKRKVHVNAVDCYFHASNAISYRRIYDLVTDLHNQVLLVP